MEHFSKAWIQIVTLSLLISYFNIQPSLGFVAHSAAGIKLHFSSRSEYFRTKALPPDASLPELSNEEIARYSRHLILKDCGMEGQRKLKAASVCLIGAGGLGCPALLYLAAAGVGRIGLVDDDVVDESNLQRQVAHGTSTVGKPKVESAAARVADLNPNCEMVLHRVQLTSDNALGVLGGYDIVLDGSDNFPTKYLINDACTILNIPCVYGAILGFEGQASVWNWPPGVGATYRDFLPQPPPPGEIPSCAEGGVLGILPGVIGGIQATEVIKLILGKGDILASRILIYDALSMRFREVQVRRGPNAEVNQLVDYQGFCGVGPAAPKPPPEEEGFRRLGAAAAAARLAGGWAPFVLDVRLPQEAEIVRLPFADALVPHREAAAVADQLPRDRDLLVHCKAGGRSATACKALAAAGFERERLFNLDGGILAWAREVDPSMPLY
mmetsp:Transcript_12942/g.23003  ORF Transcript_12942/g.23003 Transcript_12942/m.23003 type:complete len:441 (+) Transcript_12942:123-1445(+)|eukprot:CAMPEP_0206381100 /NCGR_PEP_ID=MMETSP0294-20121207/12442_1 /ASSEMBLY_ACC=CAM_ASM_000327 /TAXON_ID=39354 /ORGANISM="Heterosigma akashiwo, Strain CCMP2393" /LENGTH=440 /DNA_ID=CAMNT_0053830483 /DNA_START=120 /DNA_END=1442 /DNA_ORIENTATION=+